MVNFQDCKALSHPSNNAIFLIEGPNIFLFDNLNEVLLAKPSFPANMYIKRQAIVYNEGYIYMIGGIDTQTNKTVKYCSRYNIVTEKWQQLSLTIFDKMDAAACAINEYQIVLVGGVNSAGKLTDLVEMYDVRENTWKLFEIGLSTPRKLMSMVSS